MVIFTRNGYGYMMTMSFDAYKRLNGSVISELNKTDDVKATPDTTFACSR